MPASKYQFPQKVDALGPGKSGIATFHHPDVGTLRFRTNPNEFNWDYTINKRVDQTYGGRVIQLLGTKIDNFTLKADCGGGRWGYMNTVATYMRDVMVTQRNGKPVTFEYTTRGWKFNAYISAIPFSDSVEEVAREFEIQCKVQEDISQIMSRNTLSSEMRKLQDGVNFRRNQYNDPRLQTTQTGINSEGDPYGIGQAVKLANQAAAVAGEAIGGVTQAFSYNFLPQGVQKGPQNVVDSLFGGVNKP